MAKKLALGQAAMLLAALAVLSPAFAQDAPVDPVKQKLDEVQKLDLTSTKADAMNAASILKAMKGTKMDSDQHDTWLRYSRDFALRTADLGWLTELGKEGNPFNWDLVYSVLLAYGKLSKADIAGAEKLLNGVNLDEINVRDGRRALALRVRIAQLKKDPKAERKYIEKMIEHLPSWPTQTCQSCHDNGKAKGQVTGLPIQNLWFGERYAELLKTSGDAARVQQEAERTLKQDPNSDLAKMRLAYALRAQGKISESDATFASIPYCENPKSNLPKTRMFFAFP
jgi:hypothetical protein